MFNLLFYKFLLKEKKETVETAKKIRQFKDSSIN
tara:strand:+ start:48 stop:149 length:102 start_codon:yes stop_codon:yes gene_type:complete